MLSLAGGLPTPDSFPLADLRREADRLLGEYGPRVVQYSATDGVVELRQWIADQYTRRARPPGRGRGRDRRHARLAAGARSARQGADRSGRRGGLRVACLPRRRAGAGAVPAALRGDPRRRARHAGGAAGRAAGRRPAAEAGLRGAQLPQPVRRDDVARSPPAARRARRPVRAADHRGRPVRRHPLRRRAAAADRQLHRASRVPQHVLEDRRPRLPRRLDDRAAGGDGVGGPGQAGRRPAHLQLRPAAAGQRGQPAGLARRSRRRASCRCTATAAWPWPTRWRARSATASRSIDPTAACSCGPSSRASPTPSCCCSTPSREGVAFVPGNAFTIDQAPDAKARFSYSTLSPDAAGHRGRAPRSWGRVRWADNIAPCAFC